jgi:steroid 5-alpha reductase family enzyme
MALIWAVQQRTADAGIVDVGWAAGIGVLALAYAYTGSGLDQRRLLVGLLGGIWSFRLSTYLIIDRVRAKAEDGRYRMLRQSWSDRAPLYFFLFFQAQALLVVIFSLPFFLAAQNPTILSLWDGLGVFIFAIALLGESVADRQLARFRRDPHNSGKTCRTGLWYYSRHPNYFCEWLHWWSYVPIAFGASWGLLSLAGPIAMLFLLYFVTGIPYNEKQALASRGNEYRAYQRSTSAFFPWFPRKDIS